MKRQNSIWLNTLAIILLITVIIPSCKKEPIDTTLPTVVTSPITDSSAQTVTAGGDVTDDGGEKVTHRGVCWAVNPTPTIDDSITKDGSGTGPFVSIMKGLSPGKNYYYRAYATNAIGTAYGSAISITTNSVQAGTDSIYDARSSRYYRTQIIGSQTWMAENLAYLPTVWGQDTGSLTEPFYYVYGYDSTLVDIATDSANFKAYGVLYNWPAALSACIPGWHLPTVDDWKVLIETIGAPAGGKLKEIGNTTKDPQKAHWESPNTGATNESGFNGLPGGERYSRGGFRYLHQYGAYWTATAHNDTTTWVKHLYYNNIQLSQDWFSNANGFSVRCVKD
ncbi:MAG: fibrobacter succinogenes major paralogous domain-containing protein [Bacteroidales bacterium]|nr:fibrobacter succinogenes major paralogous domain-containing protein [Bacteroidales bacterium]